MSSDTPARSDGPVFIQFGDLRLGCAAEPRLRLPPDKAAVRAFEQREAFGRLCAAAAVDHKADVVLVTGDLFDGPVPTREDAELVLEGLAGLGSIPVLICPGDRDAGRPDSMYDGELPALLTGRPLPGNVYVFGPNHETVRRAGAAFTGRSHPVVLNPGSRPLAGRIERPDGGICVLLHHGTPHSLRNACREPTEIFTDAELLAQGFAYAAIGHSGRSYVLRDPAGKVRAADAGAATAQGRVNQSKSGALVGRLSASGVAPQSLRAVPVDRRAVFEVKADLSGAAGTAEIAQRIRSAAQACAATADDMVFVSAAGLYSARAEPPPASAWADLPYFHFRVDYSAARPDYDLEALRDQNRARPTVERRFAASLMERIEKAGDDSEREMLENALYCGLEALRHGRTECRG